MSEAREEKKRGSRKQRTGIVVSDKQNKTIVVETVQRKPHPLFKKTVKQKKRFAAHDEKNEAKRGDKVKIAEIRPLSKTKRWRLVEIISHSVELSSAGVDINDTDAN